MKLVTRDNLESWSNTTFSKEALPYLISRLVRATTPNSTKADIPSGSAIYIGGWDGVVICEVETSYVPQGISLWEFGTASDFRVKANNDYEKRMKDPLGYNPSNSVFIFVTPRYWGNKDVWVRTKKADNYWKDVIVYDSIDIEQWLDNALAVSRWFSGQPGIGSYPFDGIMTADEFWEEWATGPNGLVLLPESIISGREYEINLLLEALQGDPTIRGIKASTKNEAIAFIIAAAKKFPANESERFFSKTLIVDTVGNFRGIRINTNYGLNLIPSFDESQPLYAAVSKGHHVLVPLGADDNFNQETINLPTIDKYGQISSLIRSGINECDAEKFSKESGRNITFLKKLLGFTYKKAKWIVDEDIREIIPALILGKWNESFEGDIELIEKISQQRYDDYKGILNKWKNFEESPVINIGETWRLTSPMDSWAIFSSLLTLKDFQNLKECVALAYKSGNPDIEPDDKNSFATFFTKKKKYSNWIREGMMQSLILISRLTEVNIPHLKNSQYFVDDIVVDLLYDAKGELWVSVNHELPLIAEASPDGFIKSVKKSLESEHPEIMDMFNEESDFFDKTSHHTGLLWALEGLAWMPEYLLDASLILLTLSRLDPGGNMVNRPSNSIVEIFKPWHYQTLASFDERIKILKYITEKEIDSGWSLLIRLLPFHHESAMPTHKMRWRIFDKNTHLRYTYEEIFRTHSEVLDILISIFDYDEHKFSQLIEITPKLSPENRKIVLDWAQRIWHKVKQEKFITWEIIRKILNHHRSYPDTDWALPEKELIQYESLYVKLEPSNVIDRHIWLFNENYPGFPEGLRRADKETEDLNEKYQKRLNEEREKAVILFLKELGLNSTIDLRKQIKDQWSFGNALASIDLKRDEVISVCNCLNDDKNTIGFIHSFLYQKSITHNIEWVKSLFLVLIGNNFGDKALANIFIPLNQNQQLWEFISSLSEDIQKEYWQNLNPRFYHISHEERIFGLKMLLRFKRFFSAIDVASQYCKSIPSLLLAEILRMAATEEACEVHVIQSYEIEKIFEEIDTRPDIEKSTLINLEWLYLPILDSYNRKRNPKILEEELSNNPDFFVEVLKWIYVPKDKALQEIERAEISDEVIRNRANNAYHLLHAWKKIPGMKEDESIDELLLKDWINKARSMAEAVARLEVADIELGKVLAQFPENSSKWPQETIFKILEEINSESIMEGYSTAMFNKRGFSTRGPYDGGNIERSHAKYFEKLELEYKIKYPKVAKIFKSMKQRYLIDAAREDEEAERNKLEY